LERTLRRKRNRAAFINIPYDRKYEKLYLALIAGLCGFGLIPRATIEIASSRRRLDRIVNLIQRCCYSFHDLSRVELDRDHPPTPRFNMPFELGLAIASSKRERGAHNWFVLESHAHRLKKSLSDLDGTDPFIHDASPDGGLRELTNALSRSYNRPSISELRQIYGDVVRAARKLKHQRGSSLFDAAAFKDLVLVAGASAGKRMLS
jgi:hypothetical protein